MKTLLLLVSCIVLLGRGALAADAESVVGRWGSGYSPTVEFTFFADSSYRAVLSGCSPDLVLGSSKGTWKRSGSTITLIPSNEIAGLQNRFRRFELVPSGKDFVLVPPEWRARFDTERREMVEMGAKAGSEPIYSSFQRLK